MTKKHFITLARVLRDTNATAATIKAVADVCATINSNFDCSRFTDAATNKEATK